MNPKISTVEDYLNSLPPDRKAAVIALRNVIKKNLPKGFSEEISYGMIGYVVPLSLYPRGYLGNRQHPLPFMSIGSQKNHIAVYHMGIYADPGLANWFKREYAASNSKKLDMGKSCLRFRDLEIIPYTLIGELAAKISAKEWIDRYEKTRG